MDAHIVHSLSAFGRSCVKIGAHNIQIDLCPQVQGCEPASEICKVWVFPSKNRRRKADTRLWRQIREEFRRGWWTSFTPLWWRNTGSRPPYTLKWDLFSISILMRLPNSWHSRSHAKILSIMESLCSWRLSVAKRGKLMNEIWTTSRKAYMQTVKLAGCRR